MILHLCFLGDGKYIVQLGDQCCTYLVRPSDRATGPRPLDFNLAYDHQLYEVMNILTGNVTKELQDSSQACGGVPSLDVQLLKDRLVCAERSPWNLKHPSPTLHLENVNAITISLP